MGACAAAELALASAAAMNRQLLFKLFEEARSILGHTEYVVVGSLSILGADDEDALPPEMTMSIDVDSYTKADPQRLEDAKRALGEDSEFHKKHNAYLDPVSPKLPSLPAGWETRMNSIEHAGLRIWFLEPNDAAVSKFARGDPNDLRWIQAGAEAGYISLTKVRSRLGSTTFLDEGESLRARDLVEEQLAWFEVVEKKRSDAAKSQRQR